MQIAQRGADSVLKTVAWLMSNRASLVLHAVSGNGVWFGAAVGQKYCSVTAKHERLGRPTASTLRTAHDVHGVAAGSLWRRTQTVIIDRSVCRMLSPDSKIKDTFKKAFADNSTAEECYRDPLVDPGPFRIRPMLSLLKTLDRIYRPATKLEIPVLVRARCIVSPVLSAVVVAKPRTLPLSTSLWQRFSCLAMLSFGACHGRNFGPLTLCLVSVAVACNLFGARQACGP